ncbi:cytochrome b [Sphingosinicella rhizophila]|uniref:Cytochrome b/b6 domain-containing protein n=1 Tax=Sphingosinicella rhizophila TaxID=3050082 RepID=A0ABU3Q736_9SPHN|nr:cytochrome b/b6 domain-containing protein [Sphingosinicella sp. GR2756]MDT9598924.1 cytochrome b/b6 domain-containing protein [Sphingosinicella sp. GR2756]
MIERLRAWAATHTEQDRYSPVGIIFHWVMAALVLFQLGWGWYMGWIHPGGDKLAAYEVHGAVGLSILILALLRLVWRIVIPGPVNDADRQGWQTQAAYVTHCLFYLCFFGLPLSGWAMWSSLAEPGPLHLAGVLPWPRLPVEELSLATRWTIMDVAEDVHHLLVLLLVVLVPAHVGAALKHHFWDRHDVLTGMLPEIPDARDPQAASRHNPQESELPQGSAAG